MSNRTCSVDGCGRGGKIIRGYCGKHYRLWWRYGEPVNRHRAFGVSGPEKLAMFSAPAENGCIEWNGDVDEDGYGRISVNGRGTRSNRLAWEVHNGPIPDGQVVRHTCDNPPCVNPKHLLLGTNDDNVADRVERGRGAWGHGTAARKLSWERVAAMRVAMAGGMSDQEAGRRFGVHRTVANKVRRREIWDPARRNPKRSAS